MCVALLDLELTAQIGPLTLHCCPPATQDDYSSKGHEFFDVWAPEIASTYGQNFWTDQHDNPLPEHIVERFAGKVMAITGYEQSVPDQPRSHSHSVPRHTPWKEQSFSHAAHN